MLELFGVGFFAVDSFVVVQVRLGLNCGVIASVQLQQWLKYLYVAFRILHEGVN